MLWGGGGKQAPPGEKTCLTCRRKLRRRANRLHLIGRTRRAAPIVIPNAEVNHLVDIQTAFRGEGRVRTLVMLGRLAAMNPSHYERWSSRDLKIVLAKHGIEVGKSCGVMVVYNPQVGDRPSKALSTGQALRDLAKQMGDDITVSGLGERDKWRCHICRRKVAKRGGRELGSPSIDHLVPTSHGGLHVWQNVALAHLACNTKRNNTGIAQLQLF